MAIPQRAFYHGAVLFELSEDEHFTSINKVPSVISPNAYQLNHNTGIFIKHTTTNVSGGWRFTFTPEHQGMVRKLFDLYGERTFVIFVCEEVGFCIINFGVFSSCIDLNHTDSEWFEVYRVEGGSFRVRGAKGEHGRTIPLNAFPRVLFSVV